MPKTKTPKKTRPLQTPVRDRSQNQTLDEKIEDAAEEILTEIDRHEFSTPSVSKDATRQFWRGIIGGLETRLDALGTED